jgi:TonB family protein
VHVVLIRISPPLFCGGTVVQAVEADIDEAKFEPLLTRLDLCSVTATAVDRELGRRRKNVAIFDTARSGIIATCGGQKTVLRLPLPEQVDFERMERKRARAAALFNLFWDLLKIAFQGEHFFDESDFQRQLELHRNAIAWIPALRSGRFDGGFEAATLKTALENYRGPEPIPSLIPELLDKDSLHFRKYTDPDYPPLAKQARIGGTVKLQLLLDPETGSVVTAKVMIGHPLLAPSAVEAAKTWRFDPTFGFVNPLEVTVKYSLDCEPNIN